jgi:hypothetical protein
MSVSSANLKVYFLYFQQHKIWHMSCYTKDLMKRKEVQMNIRKTIALMGSLMILGAGLVLADDTPQKAARNAAQNRVESRFQVRTLFVDENGDGICDFARDHDSDGIPNCQDRDWARPEDGTGYQGRKGKQSTANQLGNKNGFRGNQSWNSQSARQNRANFGSGVCDGSGPKSSGGRRGGN